MRMDQDDVDVGEQRSEHPLGAFLLEGNDRERHRRRIVIDAGGGDDRPMTGADEHTAELQRPDGGTGETRTDRLAREQEHTASHGRTSSGIIVFERRVVHSAEALRRFVELSLDHEATRRSSLFGRRSNLDEPQHDGAIAC